MRSSLLETAEMFLLVAEQKGDPAWAKPFAEAVEALKTMSDAELLAQVRKNPSAPKDFNPE